jgi:hypothetical protein
MKTKLVIEFDNQAAVEHFAHWLCGSGEQHYWSWMECRESEEEEVDSGDITALQFHYHGEEDESLSEDDPKRYGDFLSDNIIRTTCGRLDRNE